MPLIITPTKLFETAIQIERNGAIFYSQAAESATDSTLRQKLLKLAADEENHRRRFIKLSNMLTHENAILEWFQSKDALEYLTISANSGIFNMTLDATESVANLDSMIEILTMARERERDSILFYTGIKAAMPARLWHEEMDSIIYEEISHVVVIEAELKALQLKLEDGQSDFQ